MPLYMFGPIRLLNHGSPPTNAMEHEGYCAYLKGEVPCGKQATLSYFGASPPRDVKVIFGEWDKCSVSAYVNYTLPFKFQLPLLIMFMIITLQKFSCCTVNGRRGEGECPEEWGKDPTFNNCPYDQNLSIMKEKYPPLLLEGILHSVSATTAVSCLRGLNVKHFSRFPVKKVHFLLLLFCAEPRRVVRHCQIGAYKTRFGLQSCNTFCCTLCTHLEPPSQVTHEGKVLRGTKIPATSGGKTFRKTPYSKPSGTLNLRVSVRKYKVVRRRISVPLAIQNSMRNFEDNLIAPYRR